MKNPIVDLIATLILLIVILVGGYLYQKRQAELQNNSGKAVVVPKMELPATHVVDKQDKPSYDVNSFEFRVKHTE